MTDAVTVKVVGSTRETESPLPFIPCANCLSSMDGHFCSRCGAPRIDERPITVSRFAADLANEITSVDSHTARTLRSLLTRPGELTRDYLAGRTRWYLTPVRLYLLTFGFMLFVRSFTPLQQEAEDIVRGKMARQAAADPHMARMAEKAAEAGADMTTAVISAMRTSLNNQWLHLIDPVTIGLLLAVLFWRRKRNLAEHVVFAMHLLAFNWIVSAGTALLYTATGILPTGFNTVVLVQWIAIGSYFFLAARHLYGQTRLRTSLKTVVFVAGAQAAMAVVPVTLGLLTFFWSGIRAGLFKP